MSGDERKLTNIDAPSKYRDRLASVDDEGKRIWVYPRKPKGRFYNARTWVSYLLLAFMFSTVTLASDLAKEKRWADQVVDAILDGEAVWLNDGTSDFLGIYTEAAEDKGRSVIVMHGTGIHPDWQQVIQPLRVGLTEHN